MTHIPNPNRLSIGVVMATALSVSAQVPINTSLKFEAASIRRFDPFAKGVAPGQPFVGIQVDPARVRIGRMDLDMLIRTAFKIKKYQLVGPAWISNPLQIFDIDAKLPEGATPDQVPLMLQALLRDRFDLTISSGTRKIDAYILSIGKTGAHFPKKDSAAQGDSTGKYESTTAQLPNQNFAVLRDGVKIVTVPGRGTQVEASTVGGIADFLSTRLQVPVIDRTGLVDTYDIKMDIHPAVLVGDMPKDPDARAAFLDAQKDAVLAPVLAAVERLGLQLERQTSLVDVIIVEHVEKDPTPN